VRRAACAAITNACASACGGQDVTALFGAVTDVDALRPEVRRSGFGIGHAPGDEKDLVRLKALLERRP
jgi:hypothetical protein